MTGIDLSEGMMSIGREKLAAAGIEATLEQGDCEALKYSEGTFDRISVGFGVRNFENLPTGLKEMHRVLKKEVLPASYEACRVVSASLGDAIGDYAALSLAVQAAEK